MAVTSWTESGDTCYIDVASPTAVTATSTNTSINMPTLKLKYTGNYAEGKLRYCLGRSFDTTLPRNQVKVYYGSTLLKSADATTSTAVARNTYATATWNSKSFSAPTSTLFNASNKTSKTAVITIKLPVDGYFCAKDSNSESFRYCPSTKTLGTINVTLNAPPTFTSSDVSINTGTAYTSLTTASITVSDISVKYGGDIKVNGVEFKIGNQTATRSDNGTLSILLDSAGTFTPTVSVTDSRGQVTTKSLNPITVEAYSNPVVNFSVARTKSTGEVYDEGQSVVAEANITWTSAIADLSAPTVSITDDSGTAVTADVTWYKDRALTTEIVDFSELQPSDMPIYAFIDNSTHDVFDTGTPYQISITPVDSIGSGTQNTQVIPWAFYTIDFLAGGHGIAFGMPATREGFDCGMEIRMSLDETDPPDTSTTDGKIFKALTDLGWTDVIE